MVSKLIDSSIVKGCIEISILECLQKEVTFVEFQKQSGEKVNEIK